MPFPRLTPTSTFAHVPGVLDGGNHRFGDAIASAVGWWAEAGVDTAIDESPRDWLAPADRPLTAEAGPAAHAAVDAPRPAALPTDLPGLHALLASGDYAPGAPPAPRRVAPQGLAESGLMIIADMPEQGDAEAGRLFAGETGALFDAMLAAMGRRRDTAYIVPLSPARLSGRGMDPATTEALVALMRRHIALAAPKGVILFGEATARLLLGAENPGTRGLRELNHDRGIVPAIAALHPRLLRQTPALKAAIWADMRQLIGVIAS